MKTQSTLRMAVVIGVCVVGLVGCAVSLDPGGAGRGPSASFTIGGRTFTFSLGPVGIFETTAGVPARQAGVIPLFNQPAADRPTAGEIRLDAQRVQAIPLASPRSRAALQAIAGTARVAVRIGDADSTDPCADGIAVGSFDLTFANGAVAVDRTALALPANALALVVSGRFTICLEVTASVNARITISEMSCTFGPAASPANGNVNSIRNSNANTGGPANVNANTAANVNANVNVNVNSPPPPPGFATAQVLHRGSEQLVAGPDVDPAQSLQTPAGYAVVDTALSGDGQRVWSVLLDEFPEPGQPQQQLWVVNTDGSGGQRSALNTSDLRGLLSVATNLDGSIAIAESGFDSSAFLRAAPGAAATLLLDTAALGQGGCARGSTRLTDDGSQFLYRSHCNRTLYRVDLGAGGAMPLPIVTAAMLVNANGAAARNLYEFDMSSDGSTWVLEAEIFDSSVNTLFLHLVHSSGLGTPTQFEDLPFDTRPLRNVNMTDDGSLIGYCIGPAMLGQPGLCHLQAPGSSTRIDITDGRTALGELVLADDGNAYYVRTNNESSGGYGFLEDVGPANRRASGTTRFSGVATPAFVNVQMSDDGVVLASAVPGGVYVLHDGPDGLPGFPSIDQISYRYDGDMSLVVRAEVTAPTGVERIYVLPLYQGLEPTIALPENQNPFFNDRSGGGVNLSTTFTEVAGSPGVWERTLSLCNGGVCKRNLITSDFRLRIIVVDATGTRTVFQDFTPLP